MLLLFCAGVCLFMGIFFIPSVSLMFISGMLELVVRALPFLCDFIFIFMQFLWQILLIVGYIIYTIVRNLIPFVLELTLVVMSIVNHAITCACNIPNAVLGFIYTAEEHAAIVAETVYYYINQIRDAFDHIEEPVEHHLDQRDNLRPERRNRLYPDIPDNLYQDSINENENNANQQNEVDRNTIEHENERNREFESHRTHRGQGANRLYPNLPTESPGNHGWESPDDDRLCVVCFEGIRDTALFPCGHTQLCQGCTLSIRDRSNRCPICQGRIVEHRRVFV